MENFFTSLFGPPHYPGQQARRPGRQQQANTATAAPPPASKRAIRQIPMVCVTAQDLADPNNRECCICLADVGVGDLMKRLNCGHLYHKECIEEWVNKHCTCPVCRYELETDDPAYERGRLERMSHRKPRYHLYELDRLSISKLRSLINQLKIVCPKHVMEKSDLVNLVKNSGKVDLIAAPEPKEFSLSELRKMGVGQLKRTMLDCGVSYDPVDVVEKEDIVQIFINSGRIVLRSADESSSPSLQEESRGSNNRPDVGHVPSESSGRSNNIGAEQLMGQSVSTLKALARASGVDLNGCLEKREIVERICRHNA
mmetsp:Transcript_22057/g.33682  ORF Transcript_22057/g.33682 Transcript_22057/m.33682 type:complete len:313 (+) Transcript_22057:121-1059(+)|eukprot:CAMPEP_0196816276 /NCGR_PEP_ID=MMETSP1362-20130617/54469_1 /TAXON_ID=163516 /ORGANISM="Leptocylindrus danicus, Strain CCMP1856" /LENGTH=312 /DNA_ID=CAMNT_0042193533 /DNA_START=106 /DNA_END=1044 /DNA_ORIENTATION=+